MTHRTRTTLPAALSAVVGVTVAGLMFVPRGDAAPPSPTAFSAEVTGEVWRVNRIDADPADGTAARTVDVGVARVQGRAGSVVAPAGRAIASAHNLQAATPPAGRVGAESAATATQDPPSSSTATGQAGTVAGTLSYAASAMSSRARWAGDDTCLPATTPLTSSRSASAGSATVPVALPAGTPPLLPIPLPTSLPSEFPTAPPSGFPTELPTDLPLPALPTGSSTGLPTDVVTSLLPTGLPLSHARRAEGDVVMASVAAARVEERTLLQAVPGTDTDRRVLAESVATVVDPTRPVMSFFGNEATLRMAGSPTLSAYSDGGANGSQVTWTPPAMNLVVGPDSYPVPTDGSALALPWSENEDIVLTLAAGRLSSAESPTGELAQADVSVLHVLVKHGEQVLLDAELFPMALTVTAPAGGIDCSLPEPPARVEPGLRIAGKDTGRKPDRLVVRAVGKAARAEVVLYRASKGTLAEVRSARLDRRGDRVFRVKDRNGPKATTYVVRVAPTDLSRKGTSRTRVR